VIKILSFEVNLKEWDKITIKISNFSIKNIKYDKKIVIKFFYDYIKKHYFNKIKIQTTIEWKKSSKSKNYEWDTKQEYPPSYTKRDLNVSKKSKEYDEFIIDPIIFYQKIVKIVQDLFITKDILERMEMEKYKNKILNKFDILYDENDIISVDGYDFNEWDSSIKKLREYGCIVKEHNSKNKHTIEVIYYKEYGDDYIVYIGNGCNENNSFVLSNERLKSGNKYIHYNVSYFTSLENFLKAFKILSSSKDDYGDFTLGYVLRIKKWNMAIKKLKKYGCRIDEKRYDDNYLIMIVKLVVNSFNDNEVEYIGEACTDFLYKERNRFTIYIKINDVKEKIEDVSTLENLVYFFKTIKN